MRRLFVFGLIGLAGFAAAMALRTDSGSTAAASPAGAFRLTGVVAKVIDGDTMDVRVRGKLQRVRVLGIDSPEMNPRECFAPQATAAARRRALGKRVVLLGDRTQATRDRYRRLLAYVELPGRIDFGKRMLSDGFATVYVFGGRPFLRLAAYRAAQSEARELTVGLWACAAVVGIPPKPAPPTPPPPTPTTPTTGTSPSGTTSTGTTTTSTTTTGTTTTPTTTTTTGTTTTTPPPSNCHASYPDFCIPPPPPDKDCADFSQKNFRVRHDVPDPDPHRLDGDKDGLACES